MRIHPISLALRSLRGERSLYGRPLETPADAAATLREFTGQDFGMDARRWGEWLRANRWVYTTREDNHRRTQSSVREDVMDFATWLALPEADQAELCQGLNPYENWALFKEVEAEFRRQYGDQPGIAAVFCGMASGLGPCNVITVSIRRGCPRTRLPKRFLGFLVLRNYKDAEQIAAADRPRE